MTAAELMMSTRLLQALVAMCTVLVLVVRQRWSCAGLSVSTSRPLGSAAKRKSSDDQQVAGEPPQLFAQIFAAVVARQAKCVLARTKACPCAGDWQTANASRWQQWGHQPPYKRDPDISVDNECIGHSPCDH